MSFFFWGGGGGGGGGGGWGGGEGSASGALTQSRALYAKTTSVFFADFRWVTENYT